MCIRDRINYGSNILSFGTRQSSTNYFNTVKITSGTVGIGMSPTGNHKLEISQVGGDGISVHSGVDFGGIRLTDNNHSYAIRNAANKFFIYDVTNTTQRLTLDDSGNFGIGASAPVHDLHIHKTATGSQARIQFTNGNTGSTNADGYAIGMEATTRLYHWLYENSYMAFATNNAERMRILATGDIGIGTDAFTNNGGNKLSIDSATNAAPATSGTTQSGGALRLRGGDNAVLDFGLDDSGQRKFATVQVKKNLRTTSRPGGGKGEPVSAGGKNRNSYNYYDEDVTYLAVSYTHLTLPTKRIV